MPTTTRRRLLRRKYRKLAAALAGVAVLSSAMLPGIPVARVLAAPNPEASQTAVDATKTQDQGSQQTGDRQGKHDQDRDRKPDREREVRSPVQVVMANAARLGFDAGSDRFSLLSRSDDRATVQVRHNGQTFKVDLERDGLSWDITVVRAIGDMTHPATYTTAGFFPLARTLGVATVPAGTTIYQTGNYDNWQWHEATYPRDMNLSVVVRDPRPTGTSAGIPTDVLGRIDFGTQLLLMGRLGTVGPQGYGIGIAKVVQTGNDLTVTVATRSPAGDKLEATKGSDYLAINRTTLDFSRLVHIKFVDQYGIQLVTYTIMPR